MRAILLLIVVTVLSVGCFEEFAKAIYSIEEWVSCKTSCKKNPEKKIDRIEREPTTYRK